jgi:ABC-type bacteriocin/lantibiotic exporter with double-glycine peptidase domain
MNILLNLIYDFFQEEKGSSILLIIISFIIIILKINILSYITANILKSIEKNNVKEIYKFYKYFVLISVFFIILYFFYKRLQANYLSKLRHWIRNHIIKRLLIGNNDDYKSKNYLKLNTPIFRIANNVFYFLTHFINSYLPNLSLIFIVSIYFLINNLIFGLIFLFGNLLIFGYILFNWKELLKYNNNYEENLLINESYVVEILNNFDKIIYRGEIKNEINNLWNNSKKIIDIAINFYNKINNYSFIINIFIFILLFILIFILIKIFINKKINSTIFITFFTILLLYRDIILSSVNEIPDVLEFITRGNVVNTMFDDIDYYKKDETEIKTNNYKLEYNVIYFENINFKYKNSTSKVLENFYLKINISNRIIGIIGKSGIGKSTFIKLLIKLYKYEGNIFIDGINIKNINNNYLRKNIVYVNQESKLFDKKIIENLFYSCENKEKSLFLFKEIFKFNKINELFKNIDLEKKAIKSGENLSGGQKQIINLINGLISDSKIIILDEPTNGLDPLLKIDIINLIKYFKKYKKCIIIISHDKDTFELFDETIIIKPNFNKEQILTEI